MDCEKLLGVTTDIAYDLLESGAEIYRVEESIQRIFAAYGAREGSIFAIPTLLILSLEDDKGNPLPPSGGWATTAATLPEVDAYNNLCRSICRDRPPLEEIRRALARIGAHPAYSPLQQIFAGGDASPLPSRCSSAGGSTMRSARWSAAWGCEWIQHLFEKLEANAFFTTIMASFAAAALAFAGVQSGLGQNLDKIIIGVLMNLVPGVALTNVMRDVIAGDLIAGLTKLVEALLVATGIALGTGVALSLGRALMGGAGMIEELFSALRLCLCRLFRLLFRRQHPRRMLLSSRPSGPAWAGWSISPPRPWPPSCSATSSPPWRSRSMPRLWRGFTARRRPVFCWSGSSRWCPAAASTTRWSTASTATPRCSLRPGCTPSASRAVLRWGY